MALQSQRFKFKPGHSIREIVIRETTGKDEAAAVVRSKEMGDKGSFLNEMVKLSIAEVDGAAAAQPFTDIETWTSKTRALVLKAYLKVNSTDDEETEDFFASAEVVDSPASKATVTIDELFGKVGSGSRGTSAAG